MNLKYFNKEDTLAELKEKRKQHLIELHESKYIHASERVKAEVKRKLDAMLSEYDWITKPENRQQNQAPDFTKTDLETASQQAENIFNAITCAAGVDYSLLFRVMEQKPNIKMVTKIYLDKYKLGMLVHLDQKIKNPKYKEAIFQIIKLSTGTATINDAVSFIVKIFKQ